MQHVKLLRSLPSTRRNISARQEAKDLEVIRVAREFGEMYFDGPREFGYGGYRYDGRWRPVAREIVEHFALVPGMRVLDVGCAKGFLVKDLLGECPGLEVFGIDVSTYALRNCEPEVVGRLHLGSAESLPFPDRSFDAIISINTLHNLPREGVVKALKEIERVGLGSAFVQVDSYYTEEERALFEDWVLTARFHDFPDGWFQVFNEAGYTGDYDWTIVS